MRFDLTMTTSSSSSWKSSLEKIDDDDDDVDLGMKRQRTVDDDTDPGGCDVNTACPTSDESGSTLFGMSSVAAKEEEEEEDIDFLGHVGGGGGAAGWAEIGLVRYLIYLCQSRGPAGSHRLME